MITANLYCNSIFKKNTLNYLRVFSEMLTPIVLNTIMYGIAWHRTFSL